MIKKISLFLIMVFISLKVSATDIAQCSNPNGKSYYPELGLIPQDKSGWSDDGISEGLTKLSLNEKGEYDIIFVDAFKRIISSREDGAKVFLNSFSKQSMTFLVLYPRKTIETYTFIKNNSGKNEYLQTTVRSGDEVVITKASLFKGSCSYINFGLVK